MTVFFRGKAQRGPFPKVAYCEFQIDGRRTVKRLGVVTSFEHARREETNLRAAVQEGRAPATAPTPATITLAQFVDTMFLPHLFPIQNSTRKAASDVCRVIARALGHRVLVTIAPSDLEQYRNARVPVVAASQVRREFYWLRRIFRIAIKLGVGTDNPALDIPLPRGKHRPRVILQRQHDRALIRAAPMPIHGDMIALTLYTGLRRAEVCGLRVGDVDLAHRQLVLVQPKTDEMKTIPLIDDALAIVRRYIPRDAAADRHLFFNRRHRPFKPAALWWAYSEARRKAKIPPKIRLHDLRHTVAVRLLEKLGERAIPMIGSILGHRPPYRTTWLYVAHVNESEKRTAMQALQPVGSRSKKREQDHSSRRDSVKHAKLIK